MSPSPSGVPSTATARPAPSSRPNATARAAGCVSRRASPRRGPGELAAGQVGDGEAGQRRRRVGERGVDARAARRPSASCRAAGRSPGASAPRQRARDRPATQRQRQRRQPPHGQPPRAQSMVCGLGTPKPMPMPVAIAETGHRRPEPPARVDRRLAGGAAAALGAARGRAHGALVHHHLRGLLEADRHVLAEAGEALALDGELVDARRQVGERAGQRRLAHVDAVEHDGGAGHVAQDGDAAHQPLGRDQAVGGDADLVDELGGRAGQRRGHAAQLAAGVVDELEVDDVAVGEAADVAGDHAGDVERAAPAAPGTPARRCSRPAWGWRRSTSATARSDGSSRPTTRCSSIAQDALQLVDDLRIDAERDRDERARTSRWRAQRCEEEQHRHEKRAHRPPSYLLTPSAANCGSRRAARSSIGLGAELGR